MNCRVSVEGFITNLKLILSWHYFPTQILKNPDFYSLFSFDAYYIRHHVEIPMQRPENMPILFMRKTYITRMQVIDFLLQCFLRLALIYAAFSLLSLNTIQGLITIICCVILWELEYILLISLLKERMMYDWCSKNNSEQFLRTCKT